MPVTVALLNEVRLLDVSYVSVLLIVVVVLGLHVAVAVVGMSSTGLGHLSRFVLELNKTRVVLAFLVLDVVSFGLSSSGFMVMVLVSGSGLGTSWVTMTVGVVAAVVVVNNGLTTSILIEFISNKN